MLIVTILSLAFAVGVFAASYTLGNFLVWKYYLDDKMVEERSKDYIEDFQQYVVDNKLFTTDMDKITSWRQSRYMELVIYKDSELIYSPEWFDGNDPKPTEAVTETVTEAASGDDMITEGASEKPEYNYGEGRDFRDYLNEETRKEYEKTLADILEGNRELSAVVFKDGTLLVTVVDYSENLMQSGVVIISFLLAFVVITVIMMIAFSKLTLRITRLALNVKRVEHGAVDIPIYSKGTDEIATLASDINSMRISIVSNMSKEREAWEANAGLITAMSHDIRTPLTVMIGYLDILELQSEDETSREYLAACRENAIKLKELSDDMFRYFLVFGKREIELSYEQYKASELIEHMLDEHILLLEERGYTVERDYTSVDGKIKVDLLYFGRVIDNMFSNLGKYADVSVPVSFSVTESGGVLQIKCVNGICNSDAESSGIGLKTCQKIMEQMGGRFDTHKEESSFVTTVSLPIINNKV